LPHLLLLLLLLWQAEQQQQLLDCGAAQLTGQLLCAELLQALDLDLQQTAHSGPSFRGFQLSGCVAPSFQV
jgi:hypothetical protein